MDFAQLFQALLALIFVIGLLFITLWFIKFCQQKGLNFRLPGFKNQHNRLTLIEQQKLDAKNSIVLVRCDSQEFLILLGNTNLLLQSSAVKVSDNV